MPELRPGAFDMLFARLAAETEARTTAALSAIGLAVEAQAKRNASVGAHVYGTKTPAWPGTGPARISGTLVRSITHTEPEHFALGWMVKVGPATGMYPTYRGRRGMITSRTQSSDYGRYLEEGLPNGARYPWLVPAARFGAEMASAVIFRDMFGSPM